ncbi:MAG: site-specific integrase [Bacteroidetes bacterium]|nr:site-specific integrase [Bacteroidota bacterium]
MRTTYHLNNSGSIRAHIFIDGFEMIRKTLPKKFRLNSTHKWIDHRASGRNSVLINQELDRIERDIENMVLSINTGSITHQQLTTKIERIINNSPTATKKRKNITDYQSDFLIQKRTEVNPRTKKRLSKSTLGDYETCFGHFKGYEFEDFTEENYRAFIAKKMADGLEINYIGKLINKQKTFLRWAVKRGLPVNKEFESWDVLTEESEEEERALNSEQLDRIYRLEVDPVEVFRTARDTHGLNLDARQVQQLSVSIRAAANQAVSIASLGPHKEDFWKLTDKNVHGNIIRYYRGKNNIECIAPFRDNNIFHAVEFANLSGGPLFKRMTSINYYLTYIRELCGIPFKITASSFRKTFGSIIYNETNHPNKLGVIMKAYGHKKESATRKYLGIQIADLEKDHEELFKTT